MIQTYLYAITPFFAWLVGGSLKFFVNSWKEKKWAFSLIGNGGMPSNHSAIVSSTATLIALKEGIDHPAFGVAVTLVFIVILDAHGLRNAVGRHAQRINILDLQHTKKLRERMGHSSWEIIVGLFIGFLAAIFLFYSS